MKTSGGEAIESSSEKGDWTPIRPKGEYLPPPINTFPSSNYRSLSEEIAYVSFQPCCLHILVIIYFQQYLVPILPQPRPSAPPFTLGGLRLATERLYLAILPVYGPFLSQLKDLATWEDYGVSLMYCSVSFHEIEIFLDVPSFLNHDRYFGLSGGTTSWLLPFFSAC